MGFCSFLRSCLSLSVVGFAVFVALTPANLDKYLSQFMVPGTFKPVLDAHLTAYGKVAPIGAKAVQCVEKIDKEGVVLNNPNVVKAWAWVAERDLQPLVYGFLTYLVLRLFFGILCCLFCGCQCNNGDVYEEETGSKKGKKRKGKKGKKQKKQLTKEELAAIEAAKLKAKKKADKKKAKERERREAEAAEKKRLREIQKAKDHKEALRVAKQNRKKAIAKKNKKKFKKIKEGEVENPWAALDDGENEDSDNEDVLAKYMPEPKSKKKKVVELEGKGLTRGQRKRRNRAIKKANQKAEDIANAKKQGVDISQMVNHNLKTRVVKGKIIDSSGFTVVANVRQLKARKRKEEKLRAEMLETKRQLGKAIAKVELDAASRKQVYIKDGFLLSKVIGKKGETINALRDETGVEFDIPKGEDGEKAKGPLFITLKGSPDGIAKCVQAIADLDKLGYASILDPSRGVGHISVQANRIFLVIGKGGAHMKKLQEYYGVRIDIPRSQEGRSTNKFDDSTIQIQITGPKEKVPQCKGAIKSLVNDGFHKLTHPGFIKKEIEINPMYVRYLIGHRGQAINSIKANSGCQVNLPRGRDTKVVVVGKSSGVQIALKEIGTILQKCEDGYYAPRGRQLDDDTSGQQEADPYADDEFNVDYDDDQMEYMRTVDTHY